MSWAILATISVIFYSIATVLERSLLKEGESDPIAYGIVFEFLLGIIFLVFTLVLGKFAWPDINYVPRIILASCLWAASTAFSFKALKLLNAADYMIVGSFGTIITIALSILFLKESLSLGLMIGTLLILLSIVLVNLRTMSFSSRKGILLTLLTSFIGGIAIINDAFVLHVFDAFPYVTFISILPGIILLSIFPRKITPIKNLLSSKTFRPMFIFTFFFAIQGITYYLAYQAGAPMSKMAPISKTSLILTVILSAIFLKERQYLPQKIMASLLATAGVILIG